MQVPLSGVEVVWACGPSVAGRTDRPLPSLLFAWAPRAEEGTWEELQRQDCHYTCSSEDGWEEERRRAQKEQRWERHPRKVPWPETVPREGSCLLLWTLPAQPRLPLCEQKCSRSSDRSLT